MKLIIHHWDTDGICSAAMIYDSNTENMTPTIGNYFLEAAELERIADGNFDEIYVVDMALNEDSMKALADIAPVKVFDHHVTKKVEGIEYTNPIIEGGDEEDFPSASWVVGNATGKEDSILAFLGAVGDWEERLKNTRFYGKLQNFMDETSTTFEEMHEMIKLIDSSYKIGDKEEVEAAVGMLSAADDVKDYVMGNEKWRRNKETIDSEIDRALDARGVTENGITIKEMDSKYNIISAVARKMWKRDRKRYVVVTNCGYFPDDCQVYVRGDDCLKLIEVAVGRGYVAGGKKNVMGAIVPKNEKDEFVKEIVDMIGGMR